MIKESLQEALESNRGVLSELDTDKFEKLRLFLNSLIAYNEHTNLVARAEASTLIERHVLDSLTLLPIIRRFMPENGPEPAGLVDVGAGGGFPGVILALSLPEIKVSLVEATAKKCRFLEQASDLLKLDHPMSVINGRAEELGTLGDYRGTFDLATARAVGTTALVSELLVPLLKVGGYALLQKTKSQLDQEMNEAEKRLKQMGAAVEEMVNIEPGNDETERVVLVLKKHKQTPEGYPRPWSRIKRD
ncbi:MAG: 16S rRNA (guanine(527)-N(7))-methyltransferase RsmG [Candidatus Obscuribacterales bacterium]|nr:16S rRNA (guanine(527)-N(7))-methyltransferase RsmG [Candidatus Obscuribacterales bacterium]